MRTVRWIIYDKQFFGRFLQAVPGDSVAHVTVGCLRFYTVHSSLGLYLHLIHPIFYIPPSSSKLEANYTCILYILFSTYLHPAQNWKQSRLDQFLAEASRHQYAQSSILDRTVDPSPRKGVGLGPKTNAFQPTLSCKSCPRPLAANDIFALNSMLWLLRGGICQSRTLMQEDTRRSCAKRPRLQWQMPATHNARVGSSHIH